MVAEVEWWEHESAADMAEELAGDLAFLLTQAIEGHGRALAALPGGPAVAAALSALSACRLDWSLVSVIPTDELAGNGDPGAAQLRARFEPLGATVVGLDQADALPFPPDLAWLRAGGKGDVAGLWAGPDLQNAFFSPRRVVPMLPEPPPAGQDGPALVLTRSAILSSRAIVMTLFGEGERRVVEEALEDGPGSRFPVGRLLAEAEQAIDIHWCP
jgi:6-phosphogluconolactonase